MNLGRPTNEERREFRLLLDKIQEPPEIPNKIEPVKNVFRYLLVHQNLLNRDKIPELMLEKVDSFLIEFGDLVTDDFEYNDLSNRVKELIEEAQEAINNEFMYAK